MKLETGTVSNLVKTGVESSIQYSLGKRATAHIISMLRSGVYSDPITACIREYWCNARDSVIAAGGNINTDVTITFPSVKNTNFVIEDFGSGLSHHEVKRILSQYGESTKRDSDDAVGCLGIGSKSAFSYTDSFTFVTRKNGIECIFVNSYADSNTEEEVRGSLNLISETETKERNGVKVIIPVKLEDIQKFYNYAVAFFKYVPEKLLPTFFLNGANLSKLEVVKTSAFNAVVDNPNFYIYYGRANSAFSYSYNQSSTDKESFVIMGGVPYKIDKKIEPFPDCVIVSAEMGAVDFVTSREGLKYTEKTKQFLEKAREELKSILEQKIKAPLSSCKNKWEVIEYINKFVNGGADDAFWSSVCSIYSKTPIQTKFGDFKLQNQRLDFKDYNFKILHTSGCRIGDGIEVSSHSLSCYENNLLKNADVFLLDTSKNTIYPRARSFFDTLLKNGACSATMILIAPLYYSNNGGKIEIECSKKPDLDKFFEDIGQAKPQIRNLSEYVCFRKKGNAPKKRVVASVYSSDGTSKEISKSELDISKPNYYITNYEDKNLVNAFDAMQEYKELSGIDVEEVYVFSSAKAFESIDKNLWINIVNKIRESASDFVSKNKLPYDAVPNLCHTKMRCSFESLKHLSGLVKGSRFHSFVENLQQHIITDKKEDKFKLAAKWGAPNHQQDDSNVPVVKKIYEDILLAYPMLRYIESYLFHKSESHVITQYIESMDALNLISTKT